MCAAVAGSIPRRRRLCASGGSREKADIPMLAVGPGGRFTICDSKLRLKKERGAVRQQKQVKKKRFTVQEHHQKQMANLCITKHFIH